MDLRPICCRRMPRCAAFTVRETGCRPVIVVIDNYDSFVHNLARYLIELGQTVEVLRNDAVTVRELKARRPRALVLSPGPCTPAEAGVCVEAIRELGATTPILGVCLGHQCVGAAFGARIERAPRPMHGQASRIRFLPDAPLFAGLPNPFPAARYHSLIVSERDWPAELLVEARSEDGLVMALRHRSRPIAGVQFHPESVLTPHGYRLLENFLAWAGLGFPGVNPCSREPLPETPPTEPEGFFSRPADWEAESRPLHW